MSSNYYNSFFSKIYIETYDSENSEDLTESYYYNKKKISKLCRAFKQILRNKFGNFFNIMKRMKKNYKSLNNNDLLQLEPTKSREFNPVYKSDDESKFYFPNNEESFLSRSDIKGDSINEQEQLRILKFEILRSKLMQVSNIFYKYFQIEFLNFLEKIKLKIELREIFNKDDNFLYFLPKPKLNRFRSIYAFRRMIYVIKSYQYRVGSLTRNYFEKWRDLSRPKYYRPDSKEEFIWNVQKFVINLQKTFDMRIFSFFLARIFFIFEIKSKSQNRKNLNKESENIFNSVYSKKSYKEKIDTNFLNYFQAAKLCDRLFTKKIKENFIYTVESLKQHSSKNYLQIVEYLKNHQPLLKIFFDFYHRKKSNRSIVLKFYHWKKIAVVYKFLDQTDDNKKVKYNKSKNVNLALDYLNSLMKQKVFISTKFSKQKLFEKMKFMQKISNTLYDYGILFKKIPTYLSDTNDRKDLFQLRSTFAKIFLMKKILLNMDKRKFAKKKENYKSVLYDTNSVRKKDKMLFFYKWKKYAIDFYRNKYTHNLMFANFFIFLDRRIKSYKFDFIARLNLLLRLEKYIPDKQKLFYKSLKNLSRVFSNVFISKHKRNFFRKLILKSSVNNILEKFKAATLILQFRKNYDKFLLNAFKKWYNNSKNNTKTKFGSNQIGNFLKSSTMKKLILLKILVLKNVDKNLKYFFTNFKIRTRNPTRGILIKSRPSTKIDHFIIQNQTQVMSELEKEDVKLSNEITKLKQYFSEKNILILKNVYLYLNKFLKRNCRKYFTKWRNSLNKNKQNQISINLLTNLSEEIELIKSENENISQSISEVKINYKNTLDDYEYLKNQFCRKCVGETLKIDYKSMKNLEIDVNSSAVANNEIENDNFNLYNTLNKNNPLNTSKIVESFMSEIDTQEGDFQKPHDDSLNRKILEMETMIKEKQTLYDMRVAEYENRMKYFEDKRKVNFKNYFALRFK